MSWVVGLPNNSYKPITNMAWVCARLCKLQKKSSFDSQLQVIKFTSCLPMVGGSPGTPASSTTKTGCHDIAESGIKTPKCDNFNVVSFVLQHRSRSSYGVTLLDQKSSRELNISRQHKTTLSYSIHKQTSDMPKHEQKVVKE
jgi:hypothetical protein